MAKKVDKNNATTTFKYNDIDDKKIYNALEYNVVDKSQFIKNALYYYISKIEAGDVLDRNLDIQPIPKYDLETIFKNMIPKNNIEVFNEKTESIDIESNNNTEVSEYVVENIEDESEELDLSELEEFDDLNDDNFNNIDF